MWHCSIQNIGKDQILCGSLWDSVNTELKKPDSDVDDWNSGVLASSAPPPVFLITDI